MGLGCKQVSSDALNWSQSLLQTSQGLDIPFPKEQTKTTNQGKRQHQQQQQEALKCPRCDSTNTKFCYYNNYNQSQPRHFCKTCKRHWTKGGTLRNVPVGGVRKTKRPKRTTTPTTPTQELNNTDQQFLPSDQNNNTFSGVLYNSSPLLLPSNCPNNNTDINYNMSANGFMGPVPLSPLLLSHPCFPSQATTNHPYEDSSSFNLIPDPFFENRKQSQLLFPHASVEEGQIPVSMPWQVPATSFAETTHDTSFWNTGDIWALLSNVGIGSDAQQEEKNTPEKQQELDELV